MNEMNVTLGNFNDSLNFAFGFSNLPHGFDVLNNPYFEFIGYEVRNTEQGRRLIEKYEFEKCSDEYLRSVFIEHTIEEGWF